MYVEDKELFYLILIVVLIVYPFATFAQNSLNQEKIKLLLGKVVQKPLSNDGKQKKVGLTINPQEINLGTITADKSGEGIFTLKSTGSEVIDWSTEGPEIGKKSKTRNYPVC